MRALKATAPNPQAGGYSAIPAAPSISPGPSPLVASYSEWTSGHAYGTQGALPRDPAAFLSGMFGPLAPIRPVPVDIPEPGEDRPEPRRWQYNVGWNMPMGMPGTEGVGKLANFQTLRTIADLYSVARACIELRKSELRGIGWDITLTKNAAKALRGDRSGMKDFAARKAAAVRFFSRPDPMYSDFSSWFDALLEEVFVTDALAVYSQPAMARKKGLLGSDIAALDLLDGTLIRPLVDIRGGRPLPPNPAFQQFLYGVPRVDLMTLLLGEDNPDEQKIAAEYRADQLMYLPFSQRTWTPYGQAPIERAIIPVMTGLNKQQYQMNFFQEGSIPGLFVSPGDPNMTPTQIRELQDALNALAGDQAWKHKIIVLPGGSKVDPQKPVSLADQFDEIVMVQVCMAFNVMPMELGITPRVSTTQTMGAGNQMAKSSQDTQERKGTVPFLKWMKCAIFDTILQRVCGQSDLEWTWEGLEEDEDAEMLTSLLVQQVSTGMRSIDEARAELGLDPWNLPATSDPGWSTERTGFIPFTSQLSPAVTGQQSPAAGQPQAQVQPQAQAQTDTPPPLPGQRPRSALTAPRNPTGTDVPGTPAHAGTPARNGQPAAGRKMRELDLLRSYLRKGGDPGRWQARDLPGVLMATIGEDLAKGLTADEVIGAARDVLAKDAADLTDPNPVEAEHVINQMRKNFPDKALGWMRDARWIGPVQVPVDRIDMDDIHKWAATHQQARVREFARQIKAGEAHTQPVVAVQEPGDDKIKIVDGHHRTLAYKELNRPVKAYVGFVAADGGPWDQTHSFQFHQGSDPANKAGGGRRPKLPAGRNPGWEHDRKLARRAARELAAALAAAVSSRALAQGWLARQPFTSSSPSIWLEDTAVAAAIQAVLTRILRDLWAAGYALGRRTAATLLGQPEPAADEIGLQQTLARAAARINGMTATRVDAITTRLASAANVPAGELEAGLGSDLGSIPAALTVTQTEVTWAIAEGMAGYYRQAGVQTVAWLTDPFSDRCAVCVENEDAGPMPFGELFPGGTVQPPQHPNCRCELQPALR
jgi:hypothetical protein